MRARQTAVAARTVDEIEADADADTYDLDSVGEAEVSLASEQGSRFSRYRDHVTYSLGLYASEWESMHKAWQGALMRAAITQHRDEEAGIVSPLTLALVGYRDELRELRDGARAKNLEKALRAHVLYPWLKSHRGCPKSVHTARLISMIGDPLRFPGRQCEKCSGYLASDHEGLCNQSVRGEPGKIVGSPSVDTSCESGRSSDAWSFCNGNVGPIRPGTGTRALWHYFGLHVVNGKRPRHQRGQQSDWKDEAYTALLQPDGIADMVIRQKCEPWYGVYVETKERICKERGVDADSVDVNESSDGVNKPRVESDGDAEDAAGPQFTRMHAHKIGRVVLAKAFVADLLAEWKRLVSQG